MEKTWHDRIDTTGCVLHGPGYGKKRSNNVNGYSCHGRNE